MSGAKSPDQQREATLSTTIDLHTLSNLALADFEGLQSEPVIDSKTEVETLSKGLRVETESKLPGGNSTTYSDVVSSQLLFELAAGPLEPYAPSSGFATAPFSSTVVSKDVQSNQELGIECSTDQPCDVNGVHEQKTLTSAQGSDTDNAALSGLTFSEDSSSAKEESRLVTPGSPQGSRSPGGSRRRSDTFERWRIVEEEKEKWLEQQRQQLLQRDIADLQPTPRINKRSKGLSRNVDDMLLWHSKTRQKQELQRHLQKSREEAACSGAPVLSSRSIELATKRQHEEGSSSDVGTRLFEDSVARERRLQDNRKVQAKEFSFKPNLATSVTVTTKSSVTEVVRRQNEEDKGEDDGLLFQPAINSKSARMPRDVPIEDWLQKKGHDYELRRQRWLEIEELRLATSKFHASTRNVILSQRALARRGQDHESRLFDPLEGHVPPPPPSLPRIVVKRNTEYYEKNLKWKMQIEERLYKERKAREDKLQETCTFTPKISVSPNKERQEESGRTRITGEKLFWKDLEWLRRRDSKLAQERKTLEDKAMKECTFYPQLQPPKGSRSPRTRSPTSFQVNRPMDTSHSAVAPSANAAVLSLSSPPTAHGVGPESFKSLRSEASPSLDQFLQVYQTKQQAIASSQGVKAIDRAENTEPFLSLDIGANNPGTSETSDVSSFSPDKLSRLLPKGWDLYVTEEGLVYYCKQETQQTQWEFPYDDALMEFTNALKPQDLPQSAQKNLAAEPAAET